MSSPLFAPLKLRDLEIKNRIFVSPMCQYSAEDGAPNDWHLVHLGSRAIGGAGLVMAEATAVTPEGRISPQDLGIWNDDHVPAFERIAKFIKGHDSAPAIQLAHAGRKASHSQPWTGSELLDKTEGGWEVVAPSPLPYDEASGAPHELTTGEIDQLVDAFGAAAKRSLDAGFEVVECHFAHGYLTHEFLSPISNKRTDEYGGSLENRMRYPLRVAEAVRAVWPDELPLFVRISASEYVEGGWDLEQSVEFCRRLKEIGVDLIDASSGGNSPAQILEPYPNYQVPFAAGIREQVGIPTGAVGLITEPEQAEKIIEDGEADAVLLARELLRDPYWPLHAAGALGHDLEWPDQYTRAKPGN